MNMSELMDKKPSNLYSSFKVIKREQKDIFIYGGNDYKIESLSDSFSQKNIMKKGYCHFC